MPSLKPVNIQISKQLDSLMSSHPVFQQDYKLISPSHFLLVRVHSLMRFHKETAVRLPCSQVKKVFRRFTTRYHACIDALANLGLLEVTTHGFYDRYVRGKLNEYRVTEKAISLLNDGNREYLRILHNDPQIRKRIAANKRKRRERLSKENDVALTYLSKALLDLAYDQSAITGIRGTLTSEQNENLDYSLLRLHTLDYKLEREEKDGRVHSPWVLMTKKARPAFFIERNGVRLHYRYVIDLRACHPTFLAVYLRDHLNSAASISISILSPTIPSLFAPTQYLGTFVTPFNKECARWMALWTSSLVDPRDVIAKEMGTSRDRIKHLINSALNDKKWDNTLKQWIRREFPCLYQLWQLTEIDRTGCNISKHYETELMLSARFYTFIAGLEGISVQGEHDGIGVFCADSDPNAEAKAHAIVEFLQTDAQTKWGFKPVIKIESIEPANSCNIKKISAPNVLVPLKPSPVGQNLAQTK